MNQADPRPGPDDWAVQMEQAVLDQALRLAPQLGWSQAMVVRAGAAAGLSGPETDLLLPHGAQDLIALLSRRHDDRALASLAQTAPSTLKMRERIARAVLARLEAAAEDQAASLRSLGFLSLPWNLALGARLTWASADRLWRWAGDVATDENHYSKRLILSGVLASALAVRLTDGSEAAERYVAARIGDVMRFEAWKAGLPKTDLAAQAAQALGRMRYGR